MGDKLELFLSHLLYFPLCYDTAPAVGRPRDENPPLSWDSNRNDLEYCHKVVTMHLRHDTIGSYDMLRQRGIS